MTISADDMNALALLVKVCDSSNVEKLEISSGDEKVLVEFAHKKPEEPVKPATISVFNRNQGDFEEYDSNLDENLEKNDKLENMMLEDPEEFERIMMEEEFNKPR